MAEKTYTPQEIKEVQDVLSGKRRLSEAEQERVETEFCDKEIFAYLFPFLPLFTVNEDLYKKLSEDERVREYSFAGFVPEIVDLIFGAQTPEVLPKADCVKGNRGLVFRIKTEDKEIIVKPVQSSREYDIAKLASELGIGPTQYNTLDGFLTEEFVEGDLFMNLTRDKTTNENMYNLGKRVGEIYSLLHKNNIFYNDHSLCDDFKRAHVIVPNSSPTRQAILFDYGVSMKLDNFPYLTDEEVFDFIRTDPTLGLQIAFSFGLSPSNEQKAIIGDEFRPFMATKYTKESVFDRDLWFVKVGLNLASQYLGAEAIQHFFDGFREVYSR